jgi:hypothetical protein
MVECVPHTFGLVFGFKGRDVTADQLSQSPKRRVTKLATVLQFIIIERFVIVFGGRLDGKVLRLIGLEDDTTTEKTSARAAGDLGEDLEGPLGGAVFRQVESSVSRNDTDKRHQWKIEAFGDHLGSDEDVRTVASEMRQDDVVGAFGARDVPIPA